MPDLYYSKELYIYIHLYTLCMYYNYIHSKIPVLRRQKTSWQKLLVKSAAPLDWRSGRGSGCTPPSGRLMPIRSKPNEKTSDPIGHEMVIFWVIIHWNLLIRWMCWYCVYIYANIDKNISCTRFSQDTHIYILLYSEIYSTKVYPGGWKPGSFEARDWGLRC